MVPAHARTFTASASRKVTGTSFGPSPRPAKTARMRFWNTRPLAPITTFVAARVNCVFGNSYTIRVSGVFNSPYRVSDTTFYSEEGKDVVPVSMNR